MFIYASHPLNGHYSETTVKLGVFGSGHDMWWEGVAVSAQWHPGPGGGATAVHTLTDTTKVHVHGAFFFFLFGIG